MGQDLPSQLGSRLTRGGYPDPDASGLATVGERCETAVGRAAIDGPHGAERKRPLSGALRSTSDMATPSTRAEAAAVEDGAGVTKRTVDRSRVRALGVDVAVLAEPDRADGGCLRLDESSPLQPLRDDRSLAVHGALDELRPDIRVVSATYYISRVPWIVPGYLLNAIFDARAAFLVLHTLFFLGGGVLFYVLCRRWLGVAAAGLGYVALIGSQMYFNAHRWDYQEGAVLTYMIGAYAFSLVRTHPVCFGPRASRSEACLPRQWSRPASSTSSISWGSRFSIRSERGPTWAVRLRRFGSRRRCVRCRGSGASGGVRPLRQVAR